VEASDYGVMAEDSPSPEGGRFLLPQGLIFCLLATIAVRKN
jgi:hypothetical protein